MQAFKRAAAPFVYDIVMNIRTEFASVATEDSKFSPCVEELPSKLRDPKPLQSLLRKAMQRAVDYIDQIMEKNKTQWAFFQQVRVLNPTNLSDGVPQFASLDSLRLPIDDLEFRSQWYTYSRVVDPCIADPTALTNFWKKRSGILARCAQFLILVPVTSADVERSFNLAGYMDSKYRRSLPNNTRQTTLMLCAMVILRDVSDQNRHELLLQISLCCLFVGDRTPRFPLACNPCVSSLKCSPHSRAQFCINVHNCA